VAAKIEGGNEGVEGLCASSTSVERANEAHRRAWRYETATTTTTTLMMMMMMMMMIMAKDAAFLY